MYIDFKDFYPNGAEYEKLNKGWGRCLNCDSGLHNLGAQYDPEDMQSLEPIACPNCQVLVATLNRKWHAPDGRTFNHRDEDSYIAHMEAIGAELPEILQPDFWEGGDTVYHGLDDSDEYEHFKAAWEHEDTAP